MRHCVGGREWDEGSTGGRRRGGCAVRETGHVQRALRGGGACLVPVSAGDAFPSQDPLVGGRRPSRWPGTRSGRRAGVPRGRGRSAARPRSAAKPGPGPHPPGWPARNAPASVRPHLVADSVPGGVRGRRVRPGCRAGARIAHAPVEAVNHRSEWGSHAERGTVVLTGEHVAPRACQSHTAKSLVLQPGVPVVGPQCACRANRLGSRPTGADSRYELQRALPTGRRLRRCTVTRQSARPRRPRALRRGPRACGRWPRHRARGRGRVGRRS